MDKLQELTERAIGDDFIAWWNHLHGTHYQFAGRPDRAPDLTYREADEDLQIEVAMAYHDEADAAFEWLRARRHPKAPTTWRSENATGNMIRHINSVLADKCMKAYGPRCILVVSVIPLVTEDEQLESRRGEIIVPPRVPFMGIYLTGRFNMTSGRSGVFKCWQLSAGA